jgi:putative glutamine amidotransferase
MTTAFKLGKVECSMSLPLIGVTTYRFKNQYNAAQSAVNEAYPLALSNAGAIPLLIPLGLPNEALTMLLPRLDGMLFTGGGDVHPARYGSQLHPLVDGVDTDRDRVEIHLLQQAVQRGLPFLGICRGLQMINVALGGSLYEDILDQRPNSMRHQYFPEMARDYLAHPIQVESSSRLAAILWQPSLGVNSLAVNSLHHQGIQRLADGLKAVAHAPDGLVEAFEMINYPFGLAVQWHPEALQAHAPMRQVFREFVQSAGN